MNNITVSFFMNITRYSREYTPAGYIRPSIHTVRNRAEAEAYARSGSGDLGHGALVRWDGGTGSYLYLANLFGELLRVKPTGWDRWAGVETFEVVS